MDFLLLISLMSISNKLSSEFYSQSLNLWYCLLLQKTDEHITHVQIQVLCSVTILRMSTNFIILSYFSSFRLTLQTQIGLTLYNCFTKMFRCFTWSVSKLGQVGKSVNSTDKMFDSWPQSNHKWQVHDIHSSHMINFSTNHQHVLVTWLYCWSLEIFTLFADMKT